MLPKVPHFSFHILAQKVELLEYLKLGQREKPLNLYIFWGLLLWDKWHVTLKKRQHDLLLIFFCPGIGRDRNQRPTASRYFKNIRMKKPLVSVIWKRRSPNNRTAGSGHFKNLKEWLGFMKELKKNWQFYMHWLFDFFSKELRTTIIYQNWVLRLVSNWYEVAIILGPHQSYTSVRVLPWVIPKLVCSYIGYIPILYT
jgi:hypothetical protein